MSKLKSFMRKYWFYIAAFMLVWMIVLINSFLADSWVTGNGTLLTGDTAEQLVPFAYELWEKVHSGDSFAYTWNIAGGCGFAAVSGYFVSPFTLLILLFPKTRVPDMVQFVMILKWALAAVTMVYFFYNTKHNTLKEHKELVSLFLGIAFVLSNSQINFLRYIQFGDVTICFPLLLLLIEKMVEEKKWILYYLVLTFTIASNPYMAFEICLFLIIWFIMQLNSSVTEKWKKFFLFAGSSVLSAATSLSTILSILAVASSRLNTTDMASREDYMWSILISPGDFIKRLFIFAQLEGPQYPTPNIYFSVFAVMLILFFPFIKIGKKRKAYMLAVMLFFIASFFFGSLSLIWHLFTPPNGVFHRFSNIFVFMMLFMALYVIVHLREIKMRHAVFVGILTVVVCVITFFRIEDYDITATYFVTALLVVLYSMLLVFYCKKSITYKNMLLVIAVFGILELTVNAYTQFLGYNRVVYSSKDVHYVSAAALADESELDAGERITSASVSDNIGLISSKASASGFISAINGYNQLFYDRLGMGVNGKVAYTVRGASPLVNLLLNIRYVIGTDEVDSSDTSMVSEKEMYQLYRTERLASLGYMVDDSVKEWDIYSVNCFDVQNDFVKLAVGGEPIFTSVTPEVICNDAYGNELERNEEYVKNNAYVYDCTSKHGNSYDSVMVSTTADEDMDLYMFSITSFNAEITIFVDDELQHNDSRSFLQSTYHIGQIKKGQKITIVAVAGEDFYKGADMSWLVRFARFNEEAYAKAYEKLSQNVYKIETMESDYIKGSIKVDKAGIMMTSIQANIGFDVYVDGEKTQYETIGGAMIGVPLDEGEHTVEFRYQKANPWHGKEISCCAAGLFVILCLLDYRKRRKQGVKVEE